MKMPWVCLDSGVFNLLTKKKGRCPSIYVTRDQMIENLEKVMGQVFSELDAKEWNHVFSPFLIFEASGVRGISQMPKVPRLQSYAGKSLEEIQHLYGKEFNEVFDCYLKVLEKEPKLSEDSIRLGIKIQKQHITSDKYFRQIFEDVIEKQLDFKDFFKLLRQAFAVDRLQEAYLQEFAIEQKENKKKNAFEEGTFIDEATKYWQLFHEVNLQFLLGVPCSALRSAETGARCLKFQFDKEEKSEKSECLEKYIESAGLKRNKDFLDTEYLQFSRVGNWVGEMRNLEPVISFTFDSPVQVESRVRLFDVAFDSMLKKVSKKRREELISRRAPGNIVVLCKDSGRFHGIF